MQLEKYRGTGVQAQRESEDAVADKGLTTPEDVNTETAFTEVLDSN